MGNTHSIKTNDTMLNVIVVALTGPQNIKSIKKEAVKKNASIKKEDVKHSLTIFERFNKL